MSIKTKVLGILSFLGLQSASVLATGTNDYITIGSILALAYNFIGQIFASLGTNAPTLVTLMVLFFVVTLLTTVLLLVVGIPQKIMAKLRK